MGRHTLVNNIFLLMDFISMYSTQRVRDGLAVYMG